MTASGGVGLLLWVLAGLTMPYYQTKINALIAADRQRTSRRAEQEAGRAAAES